MKRFFIFLSLLFVPFFSWSQTSMEIHLNKDNKGNQYIKIDKSKYHETDYLPEVDADQIDLTFYEDVALSDKKGHTLLHNNQKIKLASIKEGTVWNIDSPAEFQSELSFKVKLRLSYGDTISIKRGNEECECATFYVEPPLSKEDVEKNVSLSLINPGDSIIKKDVGDTIDIKLILSNPENYKIDSISVLCNDSVVGFEQKNDTIIPAKSCVQENDTIYKYTVKVDIQGDNNPKGVSIKEVSITINHGLLRNKTDKKYFIIGFAVVFCAIIVVLFHWWRKKNKCKDGEQVACTNPGPEETSAEKNVNELNAAADTRIVDLEGKLKAADARIVELEGELAGVENRINEARVDEKEKITKHYKYLIVNNYVSRDFYTKEKIELEGQKNKAVKEKENAEKIIKGKDTAIAEAKTNISNLKKENREQADQIIKLNSLCSILKDVAQKKNMHYLLLVQDMLAEISDEFQAVYRNIKNPKIKDGLMSPIIKGVSGLSAGILSWNEDFSVKVMGDMESFFGGEFLTMKENNVKETIAKKFVSNIVKSDSFSKFVRLYQLSTVPFIRKQLIEAGMDVSTMNKLYYRVYTLVMDFGFTIACPHLFEEEYSDSKYEWFNSTSLFDVIELPVDEKEKLKALGANIIIDINQIGYESPWISRKATVVTPDF